MIISDFSSIFELAAGLNAAFVVVEYSRSFSKQLYENAFKFDSHIENEICASQDLIDEETLKGLESVKCGEGDTGELIEKIRRDKEKLNSFIKEERDKLKASAKVACELRSHSGLSLLNFLFCLFMLSLSPIESFHGTFTRYLVIMAVLGILIVQIVCWIADAKKKNVKLFNSLTNSIRHSLILFVVVLSACFIAYAVMDHYSALWKFEAQSFLYVVYGAALLPFLNFVIFTIIFKNRLKEVQNDISQSRQEVMKLCDGINSLANKINTVSEVSHMLEVAE